jgi:Uma2 family endonuclease
MGTEVARRAFTFDDFCVLVGDGEKGDLINGVIYLALPENREANDLFCFLLSLLKVYVNRHKLGKVYGSRVAFRLDETNSPEPDIAFVRKERLDQPQQGFYKGAPDVAVEIVSPDSIDRDYKKKRKQYEKAGVLEYWIIHPESQKVTWLRRDDRGKFREVRMRKGIYRSQGIPGFWVRPEWFWQDPPPDLYELLTEMLAKK